MHQWYNTLSVALSAEDKDKDTLDFDIKTSGYKCANVGITLELFDWTNISIKLKETTFTKKKYGINECVGVKYETKDGATVKIQRGEQGIFVIPDGVRSVLAFSIIHIYLNVNNMSVTHAQLRNIKDPNLCVSTLWSYKTEERPVIEEDVKGLIKKYNFESMIDAVWQTWPGFTSCLFRYSTVRREYDEIIFDFNSAEEYREIKYEEYAGYFGRPLEITKIYCLETHSLEEQLKWISNNYNKLFSYDKCKKSIPILIIQKIENNIIYCYYVWE